MVKIKIKRIYKPLDLRDYFGKDYEDDIIFEVWVNPPGDVFDNWESIRKLSNDNQDRQVTLLEKIAVLTEDGKDPKKIKSLRKEYDEISAEYPEINKRFIRFFADLWRYEGKHPTPEEIQELGLGIIRDDPPFWNWLIASTWALINEHRKRAKKGSRRNSSN